MSQANSFDNIQETQLNRASSIKELVRILQSIPNPRKVTGNLSIYHCIDQFQIIPDPAGFFHMVVLYHAVYVEEALGL